jgi:excisionase family DNA binding protein
VSEQPTIPLPALMSVPEAAKFLGLSRASAYRYAEAGQLPIKRFGRRVYVVRARLADFLADTSTMEADAA